MPTKQPRTPLQKVEEEARSLGGRPSKLRLSDGRLITWVEFGNKDGFPIFYFHGTPGSALEGALFQDAAKKQAVRIVAVNRPGVGFSEFQPGRKVADWPADILQIADHLELKRFSVFGWSGGGPHALVCAVPLASRLEGVGLVAPQNERPRIHSRLESAAGHVWMPLVRCLMKVPLLPGKAMRLGFTLTDHQRNLRKDPGLQGRVFALSHPLAQAVSSRGVVHDNDALFGDWGVSVGQIAAGLRRVEPPLPITIWQGEKDSKINVLGTRELAARLPNCHLVFDHSATHLEIVLDQANSIIQTLKRPR